MQKIFDFASRLKAAGIHLSVSVVVASLAAALVFGLWYPWPYRIISGGQSLFLLLLSVDLTLGPLLSFVVFDRSKSKSHLVRDLSVIAALQLTGLVYGLYTVFQVRPVAIVFEVDRFRVITNVDVLHEELPEALPELRILSLTGPKILGARDSKNSDEKLRAIELSLKGFDTGTRPSYWLPYSGDLTKTALTRARALSALYKRYPDQAQDIDLEVGKAGRPADELKFLPLMARNADWSVLLDAKTGEIIGFVPYDGFF